MVVKWLCIIALCIFCVMLGFVLGFDAGLIFKEKGGDLHDDEL